MFLTIEWADPNGYRREVVLQTEDFPALKPSVQAGKSQESQKSPAICDIENLTSSERDLFEERAAIMEFDGGLPRDAAEARALLVVLAGTDGR